MKVKNSFLLVPLLLVNLFAQETSINDTIFVTASRIEMKMKSLPLSTQLITKNDIALKSIGDVASVLSGEAGIDVRNYSLVNGASTINLLGSTSQQVLVLLDGLPINSPSIGTPDLGLIPLNTLDRIEVVKGPTSSLYGANALGGVVNFITDNPFNLKKNPEYDVGMRYGSYHTNGLNFNLKSAINNNSLVFDGHRIKTNGLRTNDDALAQGLSLVSGYNLSSNSKVRVDLRYENKALGLPGPQPDTSQHPFYGDATSFTRYDRQFDTLYIIKASSETKLYDNWDFEFKSQYGLNQSRFLWVDQYSLDTAMYQDHYNTKALVGNLISRYHFTQEQSIALGIDYEYDNFLAYSQYPQDTSWNPILSKIGLFTEGSLVLRKIFRAFGSLRFDRNSGFGTFISPGIGITGTLTPLLKIRLYAGRAFHSPTLNDLYWPSSGNKNLKPEIGNAYQMGFDYVPYYNLFISTTAFMRKTKQMINWTPDTSGIWRPENIDASSINGLEWLTKYQIIRSLSIQCAGTIQNANQIRKEMVYYDWTSNTTEFANVKRQQAYTPILTLSSDIAYKSDWGSIINLNCKYTSSRTNYYLSYDSLPNVIMQTKILPQHVIFSLSLNQKLVNIVNIILKIDNIFNVQYSEQFGNSIIDKDYPRPGRTIFVGINIKN